MLGAGEVYQSIYHLIDDGDRLRFTVYKGNKIYLLNTNMDCGTEAVIEYNGQAIRAELGPTEFKSITLQSEI